MKLVIDADVMQSAGNSVAPVSSNARKVLVEMKNNGDKAYFCQKLWGEWKNHSSKFSLQWISSMVASRKLVKVTITDDTENHLMTHPHSKQRSAAIKDCHLIEISSLADKIIISNDSLAKNAFSALLDNRSKFNNIYWMSPTNDIDHINEYVFKNKIIPNAYKI